MARKKWHGNLIYYKGAISKLKGKNGLLNKWSWDDGWLSGETKTGSTAAAAKSRQSCPTLCDPVDGSSPGSRPWDSPGKNTGVGCHFLLQCMKVKSESEVAQSCLTLSNPMDCSHQAPPSIGFSRQEYWSGVPLPSPWFSFYVTLNAQIYIKSGLWCWW